jgi:hypothetical protein
VYGVLNNFNLAVGANVQSVSSKQRTGTKPFMAIDLLRTDMSVHMYRNDLESIFYVLVWITVRFHNEEEISDPPLQEWADRYRNKPKPCLTILYVANQFLQMITMMELGAIAYEVS